MKFLDEDQILNADELASINKEADGPTSPSENTLADEIMGKGLMPEQEDNTGD